MIIFNMMGTVFRVIYDIMGMVFWCILLLVTMPFVIVGILVHCIASEIWYRATGTYLRPLTDWLPEPDAPTDADAPPDARPDAPDACALFAAAAPVVVVRPVPPPEPVRILDLDLPEYTPDDEQAAG